MTSLDVYQREYTVERLESILSNVMTTVANKHRPVYEADRSIHANLQFLADTGGNMRDVVIFSPDPDAIITRVREEWEVEAESSGEALEELVRAYVKMADSFVAYVEDRHQQYDENQAELESTQLELDLEQEAKEKEPAEGNVIKFPSKDTVH